MAQITYANKVKIDESSLPAENKVRDLDMNEIKEVVNENTPAGLISAYAGDTAPNGWLICDGSAISRTTYSRLFNVIGTAYGTGDGSTTFNLPDLRHAAPVGVDSRDSDFDEIGKVGGEKNHTLTVDEMPEHYHNIGNEGALLFGGTRGYFSSSGPIQTWANNDAHSHTNNKGGSQAHNNMQPYVVLNYIISY